MNEEIIYLKNFSRTRETFAQKPKHCMSVFIYIVLAASVIFIICSAFVKVDNTLAVPGYLENSAESVTVLPPFSGTLENTYYRSGSLVSSGDIIASLLTADSGALRTEYISAPTGGIILYSEYVGSAVSPESPFCRIIPDSGGLSVVISVPEKYYDRISEGMTAAISVPGTGSARNIDGRISWVSSAVCTSSSGFTYFEAEILPDEKCYFSENGNRLLYHMDVTAVIDMGTQTLLEKILSTMHFTQEG